MKFNSVSNPSISEITEWAYSEEEWPHHEWDLFLSWKQDIKLFIEFATDHRCPKQAFFLHMLYYVVGCTIRGLFGDNKEFSIESYLKDAEGVKHGDIKIWIKKTKELLRNPDSFTYDDWCCGHFAKYDFT